MRRRWSCFRELQSSNLLGATYAIKALQSFLEFRRLSRVNPGDKEMPSEEKERGSLSYLIRLILVPPIFLLSHLVIEVRLRVLYVCLWYQELYMRLPSQTSSKRPMETSNLSDHTLQNSFPRLGVYYRKYSRVTYSP